MRRLVLALGLAALVAPAPAGAATLTLNNGVLTFTGNPPVNRVAFQGGPSVDVIAVAGNADPIDKVSGCRQIVEHVRYVCDGVTRVVAFGGGGDDAINGERLTGVEMVVAGGDGNDRLTGGPLADTLDGGAGNDDLDGRDGADRLSGAAGDDFLQGALGTDVIGGGPGIDTAYFGPGRASITVTLDGVANDGAQGETDNVLNDVEDVTANADGDGLVTLRGDDAGNVLDVDNGVGRIEGGAGSDTLYGGPLDDVIDARDGYPDRIYCNGGNDIALVDTLDTVSESCENVPVTVVAGGADDRPPAVAWATPASGARFRGDAAPTLVVAASDDRGVAKVQFYDDTRLLCEVAAPPYACAYHPRGADLGRNTLIAVAIDGAGQATSASRLVDVTRFRPRLSLRVSPRRDRRAAYVFHARGALRGAGACSGRVRIKVKAGGRTIATRRAKLRRNCRYRARVRFAGAPASRLRVTARFPGNRTTRARSSRGRTVRLG
jgi:hypothetical protein